MSTSVRQHLFRKFKSKGYRDAYVDQNIRNAIAFQIRAMREDRGWTQSELGARTGKKQEVISQLESPEYGSPTINTLKRLASAFDVGLIVRFVRYNEIIDWASNLSQNDLAVPSFENDVLPEEVSVDILAVTNTGASLAVEVINTGPTTVDTDKVTVLADWLDTRMSTPQPTYKSAGVVGG